MSIESELYITTYDGQPFDEEELLSLWTSPSWRQWLIQKGYSLLDTKKHKGEIENKSVIIEIWQIKGETAPALYALYHSPLGPAPNNAGLYLAISDQLSLTQLLAELEVASLNHH